MKALMSTKKVILVLEKIMPHPVKSGLDRGERYADYC